MDTKPIQRDPLTPGQAFPEQGRLPQQPRDIAANLAMQQAEHMAEQSRINIAAGRVRPRPCCMPLHSSRLLGRAPALTRHDAANLAAAMPCNTAS